MKEENIIENRWDKKKDDIHELSNNIHRLKANITKDLKSDNEKEALTALVLATMNRTAERVGNQDSADNGHFGVTGLKKKHVKTDGNKVTLIYTGKSGVKQNKEFSDERIANGFRQAIKNSPSSCIFETCDGFNIKNDRINRYLEEYDVSAKALRGYAANKLIVEKLNKYPIPEEEKKRKTLYNTVSRTVADHLGHGVSTLKKHYLVPELPVYYVEKGKIVDIKNLGYYKIGGEIPKKKQTENKKQKVKNTQSIFTKTFTFKQLFA